MPLYNDMPAIHFRTFLLPLFGFKNLLCKPRNGYAFTSDWLVAKFVLLPASSGPTHSGIHALGQNGEWTQLIWWQK